MSLKRKASFPNIASPQSPQTPSARHFTGMDDSPKHLNCRTRKRVMNIRPNDQAVYDKTLRWLFTAQQRVQQIPTPPTEPEHDEDMELEAEAEAVPLPAPDHRQQSLLQFFRPAQPQQHPRPSCPSTPVTRLSGEPARGGAESVSPAASEGGTMTPSRFAGCNMDGDMDIDMDMDVGGGEPTQGPGWMR
ncbi:uncharacterized protein DSM5745_01266 [Aspergillus mulundensis]|uniref:Uncharacterized protein n=1 Tax=Aspergillus mulundensis TaxID=1810919 RepID=A0A3D8T5Z1_9EURO|nr:hypothetical protein DSM5745_01266 [Aspergillus mulundensis]RDW93944.1 hypothetical protein DSM5745_01266 [Aspergillus mulundensis]